MSLAAFCVLGLTVAALLGAIPAQAAFPGANGRIVFDRFPAVGPFSDVIATINPNGTEFTALSTDPANSDFISAYSADGSLIAFTRVGATSGAIWVMNADGSGAHQVTNPPTGSDDSLPGGFSPDGKQLVFERRDGSTERVWVVNTDGSNPHQLLTPPAGIDDENPTISPDGQKIAFMREDAVTDIGQIMLVNANGTGAATPVTSPPANFGDHDPNFSPDGKSIVFTRSTSDTVPGPQSFGDVLTVNTDGTGVRNLTNETPGLESEDPAYSPDGTMIVFARCVGDCDSKQLLLMRTDGSGRQEVTPAVSTQSDSSPNWQPIAFRFAKLKRNLNRGTAKQKIILGAAGTLVLSGKGIKGKNIQVGASAARAGAAADTTVALQIKPKGKARKTQLRKHKVGVKIKVTFTPANSFPSTLKKKVKLKLK